MNHSNGQRTVSIGASKFRPVSRETPAVTRRPLAPRERETLELLLLGRSEKEASQAMGISQHTVHMYVKAIYRTYHVNSRSELLISCLGRGLTDRPDQV